MTEAEWLACDDPGKMIVEYLGNAMSGRKHLLLATGCLRRVLSSFPNARATEVVRVFEQIADDVVEDEDLKQLHYWAHQKSPAKGNMDLIIGFLGGMDVAWDHPIFPLALNWLASAVGCGDRSDRYELRWREAAAGERTHQAKILRDIFGNPFRPVAIASAWQSANVVSLAQTIYDERAFHRMPVLGDALEDAGCGNAEMLNHCRQGGEHVRGCWLVDLLLGKK